TVLRGTSHVDLHLPGPTRSILRCVHTAGVTSLYNKLDAYALQDSDLDTYDANTALGLPEDGRDYTAAAQMLTALGTTGIDLLSNNPDKAAQLAELGIVVRHRVPTGVHLSASNVRYLRAKVERTGHSIELSRLVG
ncbi:GTP cyclohydrolase, partial [Kitasatospora sp. NPDC093102]